MLEMLLVVGLIAVLSAVSFIGVFSYLRRLNQLEKDGSAKEIFIAAQNHLSMAESQGYLERTNFGAEEKKDGVGTGVYYFIVGAEGSYPDDDPNSVLGLMLHPDDDPNSVLGLMLPLGSIDESVRTGGSYIIRYQKSPARMLDVFYSNKGGRMDHTFTLEEYNALVQASDNLIGEEKEEARRNYGDNKDVIGWYGGDQALDPEREKVTLLKAPKIQILNAERLQVIVEDTNTNSDPNLEVKGAALQLEIEGELSGLAHIVDLVTVNSSTEEKTRVNDGSFVKYDATSRKFTVTLDDITSTSASLHFGNIIEGTGWPKTETEGGSTTYFIPGENLKLTARAYNNLKLSNIAETQGKTNSLFGNGTTAEKAVISNIRHLENLSETISNLDKYDALTDGKLNIKEAEQTTDLDWTDFRLKIAGVSETEFAAKSEAEKAAVLNRVTVSSYNNSTVSEAGTFMPIDLYYLLAYKGNQHSISNVCVNTDADADAGLFGRISTTLSGDLSVKALELINFDIETSGEGKSAGALAGSAKNLTAEGVLVRNIGKDGDDKALEITASGTDGIAGGLIGSMNGGSVNGSAAAVYVKGGSAAGGLVGKAEESVTIENSYSGGHTKEGKFVDATDVDDVRFNVIAADSAGVAGGLVGTAATLTANYCYSTCSATGSTAGGFAGTLSDSSVKDSYAAGLVKGTTKGMIAGTEGSTTFKNVRYLEGVSSGTKGLSSGTDPDEIKAFKTAKDEEADSTNGFIPKEDNRAEAVPYDSPLTVMYLGKYLLKTVDQLRAGGGDPAVAALGTKISSRHYGDWLGTEDVLKTTLAIENAERLSANISFPLSGLTDLGGETFLSVMVKGETSGQNAYLLLSLKEESGGSVTASFVRAENLIEDKKMELTATAGATVADDAYKTRVASMIQPVQTAVTGGTDKTVTVSLTFDDITASGMHFADLFPTLTPGENIKVAAVGGAEKDRAAMAEFIAEKATWGEEGDEAPVILKETNSLFGGDGKGTDKMSISENVIASAFITNIRHLENLHDGISSLGLAYNTETKKRAEASSLTVTKAVQKSDLYWTVFMDNIKKNGPKPTKVQIYDKTNIGENASSDGSFFPVSPTYALTYDGTSKKVEGIKVQTSGAAGVFGELPAKDSSNKDLSHSISNLELLDCDIESTGGSAGALAGKATGTDISNVLVHNTVDPNNSAVDAALEITASGSAGGLVGELSGGSVTGCAAAVYVKSTGSAAGGLIGTVSGTEASITGSYSGGHTKDGAYLTLTTDSGAARINVIGSTAAGGLIGDASGTNLTVRQSYSTCSARGETAGGFIGKAGAGTIGNSYATGLVTGTNRGAFAGSATGTTFSEDSYMDIVNYTADNGSLPPVAGPANAGVSAFDSTTDSYDAFVQIKTTDGSPATAVPYDSFLKTNYNNKYLYKSAANLGYDAGSAFVSQHYGDWPSPETMIVNTPNT